MADNKKPFHEAVAESLIEQLKSGTAPWQKPWSAGSGCGLPHNPVTGNRYKGINAVHLMGQEKDDPRWLTYKQAKAIGAQVKKGEKGTSVQYWKFEEQQTRKDSDGNEVTDSEGRLIKDTVKLERPKVFFASVFNGSQIEDMPPLELSGSRAIIAEGLEALESVSNFLKDMKTPPILQDEGVNQNPHLDKANSLDENIAGILETVNSFGSDSVQDVKELLDDTAAYLEKNAIIGDALTWTNDAISHIDEKTWERNSRAEQLLVSSGAKLLHDQHDRAFYNSRQDEIHLPDKEQFQTTDAYYATALHELGHWTGHESRLDRDLANPFGSEAYAMEELRAEIASMILGDELGIGHDPSQHAAYVDSWIKVLDNDPLEIIRAASDAEKIQAYVLGLEQQQQQEQKHEQVLEDKPTLTNSEVPVGERSLAMNNQSNDIDQKSIDAVMSSIDDKKTSRFYIDVPYKEKEEAKSLGARWDRQEKSWYVPPGVESEAFTKWTAQEAAIEEPPTPEEIEASRQKDLRDVEEYQRLQQAAPQGQQAQQAAPQGQQAQQAAPQGQQAQQAAPQGQQAQQAAPQGQQAQERVYLAVSYEEKGQAKAAGARWDSQAKSWYAGPNSDMEKLSKWLPDRIENEQSPAMSPREEFGDFLRSMDFVVSGEHPIMDGNRHRMPTQGDNSGEKSGFYKAYSDGRPAGYAKNHRTGVEGKWKAKGYSLTPEQRAKMQAESAATLARRAVEQEKTYEATAERVMKQAGTLEALAAQTPYHSIKGIQPHAGALTDKGGQKAYIPAFDADEKQWTMQYIQEDGTKRFAKDSKKEGCFHPVGGFEALEKAPVIVIAEGYATAATVSESLQHATVAAFDAGNLPSVAKSLHEKYPDKEIIIAGDDDKRTEKKQGINPGKAKAKEAAELVGGKAVFPIFAPGEQEGNPKEFSDFNDLAAKSSLGKEAVLRQIKVAIDKQASLGMSSPNEQAEKVKKEKVQTIEPRKKIRI